MYISLKDRTVNRELSWLSFNYRVLQEAQDPRVPLIERLRFLGIFSNNLDEFFRVRVATMKRIKAVSRKKELLGDKRPSDVLEEIQAEVLRQKEIFADTFDVIIRKLEDHNIVLIDEWKLSSKQEEFVEEYYREQVAPLLVPIMLRNVPAFPYLRDKSIYLAVKLTSESKAVKKQLALIEIPSEKTSRFVE
ncbi:MAG: polyphosphate kinase 1, partial [Flavobacteriales bacterium]|nr:polyphosphate kinase 1 [Flavobacteriales bacterium]